MREGLTTSQRRSLANRGFSLIVFGSIFVHSAAIGAVMYSQHRRPQVVELPNAIPVQLVALGKKRDPELLPRKMAPDPPPEAPPDEGVALDTGKKDEPAKPKDDEKKSEKKDTKLSAAARRLLEGSDNRLDSALERLDEREGDPDGDVQGTTTDRANAAAGYQRAIIKALKTAYRLPETIPASQRQFLKAQVLLFIERDGSISKFEFVESHPNEIFMGALDSLLRAIKLPPPPASEAASLKEAGVLVRFTP